VEIQYDGVSCSVEATERQSSTEHQDVRRMERRKRRRMEKKKEQ